MESQKKTEIKLSIEEILEIEPIVERANGLEELLLIASCSKENIQDSIESELAELNKKKYEWLENHVEDFKCENQNNIIYEFDFLEKKLSIFF